MKIKHSLLAVALGLILGGSVSAADMSASEAEAVLARSGFTQVSNLEYLGGLWLATAVNSAGQAVEVRLDPLANQIMWDGSTKSTTVITQTKAPVAVATPGQPVLVEQVYYETPLVKTPIMYKERVLVPVGERISRNDVVAVLAANGYHNIHDIDWLANRNVWKAEARDASGDDREIHLDPLNGAIIHNEND